MEVGMTAVSPQRNVPTDHAFRPKLVLDVELTAPIPSLPAYDAAGRAYGSALVLVRLHTEPLGVVEVSLATGGCDARRLAGEISDSCGRAIIDRLEGVATGPVVCPPDGLVIPPTPFLEERRRVLRNAPPITVVVCTVGRRPQQLSACLARLARLEYPRFEILVVDNEPASGSVAAVVEHVAGSLPVPLRSTVERRPGLSWARNRALSYAETGILAFIDDDEQADPHWLAEIARGFASEPDVVCVTGSTVPTAVDTQAQDWFEQWGGHVKGRGFQRAVFDRATLGAQSPLYPLPPFGTGGNFAFRRDVVADLGGFDVALGAGTPAGACEDTDIFARLLMAGHRIVYQPSALVRHSNRATLRELKKQLYEYGLGLTAYFTAILFRDPRLVREVVRLLAPGIRDLAQKDSMSRAEMTDFPASLRWVQRRGMLAGPIAYLRSRRRQRRWVR
jgi:GT2 family glycosyltransferase